jgi:PTH1 family peptidyl-tRNA hydrolase
VVGLGNPGSTYADTRHNVGAMVVDELARRARGSLRQHKRGRAEVLEVRIGPPPTPARAVLARPRSFMNDSGGPVSALLQWYALPPSRLVVVHDEIDLPFDGLRLKCGGGDNGHNGLRSVRASIGTGEFLRVRVGVGRPTGRMDPADYVLRTFSPSERKQLPIVVGEAADAVETLLLQGLDAAQQQFNR